MLTYLVSRSIYNRDEFPCYYICNKEFVKKVSIIKLGDNRGTKHSQTPTNCVFDFLFKNNTTNSFRKLRFAKTYIPGKNE